MAHRRTALVSVAVLGLVTLIGSALTSSAGPANAATPTCDGKPATHVVKDDNLSSYWEEDRDRYVIEGTGGNDVIVSTVEEEVADIEIGPITLLGLGGDDSLCASAVPRSNGEDPDADGYYTIPTYLSGGAGSDTLIGSTGTRGSSTPPTRWAAQTARSTTGPLLARTLRWILAPPRPPRSRPCSPSHSPIKVASRARNMLTCCSMSPARSGPNSSKCPWAASLRKPPICSMSFMSCFEIRSALRRAFP